MDRPPVIPAEKMTRIVLSVLAGEMTVAEAGMSTVRSCELFDMPVCTWRRW